VEAYCVKTAHIRKYCEIRECFLAGLETIERQAEDHISGISELVSNLLLRGDIGPLLTLPRLKDSDVTWLYGPLQTGSNKLLQRQSAYSSSCSPISKSHLMLHKKSILKKQCISKTMLQRSLLSSSFLQRAIAAIQAQRSFMLDRPYAEWPDVFATAAASRSPSGHHVSFLSSVSLSEMQSPCPQRRNALRS
jgi:hypothetical protein